MMLDEKPYDRVKIKFKFTNGYYHIHEIQPVYDLVPIQSNLFFYLDQAREYLEIDDSVEVEYARALREGEDEAVD